MLMAPRGSYRGEKQLVYADALYVRPPDAYVAAVERSGKDPRTQLLKAVTICAILGYQDPALPYLRLGRERAILSEEDARLLETVLAASARSAAAVVRDVRRLVARVASRLGRPGR
jgi:hypothetical protein